MLSLEACETTLVSSDNLKFGLDRSERGESAFRIWETVLNPQFAVSQNKRQRNENNLQKTTVGHSAPDVFILQNKILVYKRQLAILRHAKTVRQNSSEIFSMQSVCETSLRQREAVLVKEEGPSLL